MNNPGIRDWGDLLLSLLYTKIARRRLGFCAAERGSIPQKIVDLFSIYVM
jgi:hypothetical protein